MQNYCQLIPVEMDRVNDILNYYKRIGPKGVDGAKLIEEVITKASYALSTSAYPDMIEAYAALRSIE